MRFCVDKRVVGAERHLVCDICSAVEIYWASKPPQNCLFFGCSAPPERDLKLLLELGAVQIQEGPGEPWEVSMRCVLGADSATKIPWSKTMPKAAWEDYARRLCEALRVALKEVGSDYYLGTYLPSQGILEALEPACIDEKRRLAYLHQKEVVHPDVIESFGRAKIKKTTYSRTTSTGRLRVDDGPIILRLKKTYRDIIKSRYEGGQILSLDYVSLEPRLCLYLAQKPIPDDVYADIMENVLDGALDRKSAKKLVLAVLYGAGTKKLQETIKKDVVTISSYIMLIKKYFGVKERTKKLVAEQAKYGFIRNFYGKVLRLKNPVAHKLYNAYIQSTAVDVALLGFSQLKFKEGIHPIFVLHDALLADCKPGVKIDVSLAEKVPGIEARFPLLTRLLINDD